MKKLYAIVDIETTGGTAARDKITEIAIVHHDGERITDKYSTLVNPERSIPYHIIGLTGITNDMVANAPKFYEVAKEIIEWTEGRIFVAHNVNFDYGFLKEEFKSLGYTFTRSTLDTVRLSRLAFPGHKSYSLSNLILRFDLTVKDRHRALDDAWATAQIFTMIMESRAYEGTVNNFIAMGIRASNLPQGITLQDILGLPESHGVYYFRNNEGTLIYVGKSKNIKSRIAQHFTDHTAKSTKIRQSTHTLDYVETGNELAALIRESIEIRSLNPLYNKAQRNASYPYVLIIDEKGIKPTMKLIKTKDAAPDQRKIKYFTHKKLGEIYLNSKVNELAIRFSEIDEEEDRGNNSLLNMWLGLQEVTEEVSAEILKSTFHKFISQISLWFDEDFLLIAEGRSAEEKCIFMIHNGQFYGYEYLDETAQISNVENMKDHIKQVLYHPEMDLIIHHFIKKNPGKFKLIKF